MTLKEREELEKWIDIITEKAAGYGLDFYPTHFEVVPDHVIYELGSYVLPARFSHWTFGRDYHRQKTSYEYGMSKIYEIVFNTDPCQAFLLDSNSMLAHKFVVAHVLGHNDFFKNNIYFEHTDRSMVEKVRLHANRIRKYEEEFGALVIEEFLDAVLSIEEHFDTGLTAQFRRKPAEEYEAERRRPEKSATEFDDIWNMMETKSGPQPARPRKFPPEPEKDLLGFLRDHAPELEKWQRDILNMIREEMIYFIPQMRTKTINEGWACATAESLLLTEQGILRFKDIVEGRLSLSVASGKPGAVHPIIDFHKEAQVPTLRLRTRRGYTLEGAEKHRVQLADGSYAYLHDVKTGDRILLAHNTGIWASEPVALRNFTIGCEGQAAENTTLDESLAHLLGYFTGRGCLAAAGLCLNCEEGAYARYLACLAETSLEVPVSLRGERTKTGERWHVEIPAPQLLRLLETTGFDLQTREKQIPDAVLRSPVEVVSAFLRGYADASGQAGKAGIRLSVADIELARTLQILLLNYGILSRQRPQSKNRIALEIRGASAVAFREQIGFQSGHKQEALDTYTAGRRFRQEDLTDEIVAIEQGTNDVYDITVDVAHAYVANGFINHNSFWHERIMTDLDLTPEEHLEFRRMHASVLSPGSRMSINPYYVGYNILHDIVRRWDGEEDEDHPETDWQGYKYVRPNGEGLKKIFEVRQSECDTTFLRKYLTQGLVERLDMYTYRLEEVNGEQMWVVQDTDWRKVRDSLLDSMTNFGIPMIYVEDADFRRRNELLLKHAYDGKPLDLDYTARTLKNIYFLWKRPVHLETIVEEEPTLLTYDGDEFLQEQL